MLRFLHELPVRKVICNVVIEVFFARVADNQLKRTIRFEFIPAPQSQSTCLRLRRSLCFCSHILLVIVMLRRESSSAREPDLLCVRGDEPTEVLHGARSILYTAIRRIEPVG